MALTETAYPNWLVYRMQSGREVNLVTSYAIQIRAKLGENTTKTYRMPHTVYELTSIFR